MEVAIPQLQRQDDSWEPVSWQPSHSKESMISNFGRIRYQVGVKILHFACRTRIKAFDFELFSARLKICLDSPVAEDDSRFPHLFHVRSHGDSATDFFSDPSIVRTWSTNSKCKPEFIALQCSTAGFAGHVLVGSWRGYVQNSKHAQHY